jgi:phosphopantothenoylcysteine decarboxylase / phosphopantothenate---cysteine ligase
LVANPDVIATLAKAAPKARTIGFAAEPSSDFTIAQEKIARKGLYAIAMNDVSRPGQGFDAEDNDLTLLYADGRHEVSGLQSKFGCAAWLLERVAPS